jgi:hypothetical protein
MVLVYWVDFIPSIFLKITQPSVFFSRPNTLPVLGELRIRDKWGFDGIG